MNDLVFIDTETTGLHTCLGHRPWEVALIRIDPATAKIAAHGTFMLPMAPGTLMAADPDALTIGGFIDRYDRVDPVEVVGEAIARLCEGATVAGAQPRFDTEMLNAWLHDFGFPLDPWHHRTLDIEAYAAGHLAQPIRSLSDTAEAVGIDVEGLTLHRAYDDAFLALRIYDAIARRSPVCTPS